jgi:serine/threonine-protein kinase
VALSPGVRLGAYGITALIGRGGMGEVWLGTDVELGRAVAIKVLPDSFARDGERLARFEREARTLAALNHPNIASIYGVEKTDGGRALVMELVDGMTLADRIGSGPLPIDEAILIAKQIAAALEAAHAQGIIHRDLKPANIKVRDDGTVKVLDFGLAKALESAGAAGDVVNSPTITSPAMTERGVILGTAAYMSPEQARGKPVDRRADIWAFGCVFYEMLTGRRAFEGEDVSETLAAVLRADVDWTPVPAGLSPVVRTFLTRCLRKDPKQRIGDIQDVRLAFDGAFDVEMAGAASRVEAGYSARRLSVAVGMTALFVGTLVGGFATWTLRKVAEPQPVSRYRYVLPDGQVFRRTGRNVIAVSPDGQSFVYNTTQGLYLRAADSLDGRLITGTEEDLAGPFFSPDGQSVGFFAFGARQLKRIAIAGGVSVAITPASNPQGVSWERDGTILFAEKEGILRVPVSGGTPTVAIPAMNGELLQNPQLLPDGETVLFTSETKPEVSIFTQSVRSSERKLVIRHGQSAHFLETGHLVYTIGDDLFAVAFDVATSTVKGAPTPLEQGILGGRQYGLSDDGTLRYVRASSSARGTPVLVDRNGVLVRRLSQTPLDRPRHPAIDATGERVALVTGPRGKSNLWFYFLDGRPPLSVISPGDSEVPIWSPSADRLALGYSDGGRRFVYLVDARPISGAPTPFFTAPDDVFPQAWSADGKEILLLQWTDGRVQCDLVAVSVADSRQVRVLAAEKGINEYHGRLSPDGRWLAYGVWRPGSSQDLQIHARPFSSRGDSVRLPADRGNWPLWSRDGTELFYVQSQQIMAMAVNTRGPVLSFGLPKPLFTGRYMFGAYSAGDPHTYYDVDAKGRFVFIEPEADTVPNEVVIVLNLQNEVKRLLATN